MMEYSWCGKENITFCLLGFINMFCCCTAWWEQKHCIPVIVHILKCYAKMIKKAKPLVEESKAELAFIFSEECCHIFLTRFPSRNNVGWLAGIRCFLWVRFLLLLMSELLMEWSISCHATDICYQTHACFKNTRTGLFFTDFFISHNIVAWRHKSHPYISQ